MLAPTDEKETETGDVGKKDDAANKTNSAGATESKESKVEVVYKFCDKMTSMINAWKKHFAEYIPDRVQVYSGDIFKEGPAADAIVSPANSFGFMDGGIDMAYSRHFGWQMQDRLQEVIRTKYRGELLVVLTKCANDMQTHAQMKESKCAKDILKWANEKHRVGDAIIITTIEGKENDNFVDWAKFNEGQPIKYLISAPTMRVPMDVANTANAYLAFRAIILAVEKHNNTEGNEPIRSVLCPGLGTAVGRMPAERCAHQMLQAFETFEMELHPERILPTDLGGPWGDHVNQSEFGESERERAEKLTKAKKSTKSAPKETKSSEDK